MLYLRVNLNYLKCINCDFFKSLCDALQMTLYSTNNRPFAYYDCIG